MNENKKIILLTKHKGNLEEGLEKFRIKNIELIIYLMKLYI